MLHVPAGTNTFGAAQASWGTARPASAQGTAVTPVVGAKGSWASLITATNADSYGLLVYIGSNSASNAARNTAVDIGVDESGGTTYEVKVADLLGGGAAAYTLGGLWYYFPVFVPAGSRIAARAQSTVTTATRVAVVAQQKPFSPSQIRKGSLVETIGVTGVAGTTIVPGTTSEGAWTLVGTTTARLWWWQVAMQVATADTAWAANAIHVDLAVGDGTNFDTIINDLAVLTSTAEAMNNPPLTAGVEWSVPPGSSIYVRAQNSGTLDQYQCAVYGVGG